MTNDFSYKDKKVITIGVVRDLTGLSERQIRYYEERKLIFPERSSGGSRKYSFSDVELLVEIANKIEDGVQTHEIRKEMLRAQKKQNQDDVRRKMIQGTIECAIWFTKRSILLIRRMDFFVKKAQHPKNHVRKPHTIVDSYTKSM